MEFVALFVLGVAYGAWMEAYCRGVRVMLRVKDRA